MIHKKTFLTVLLVVGASWAGVRVTEETPARAATTLSTGGVKGTFKSLERLKTKGDTSQRDVVVYLEPKVAQQHVAPTAPIVVHQEKLVFKPHVLAVLKGSKVQFENGDDVVHNVFSTDDCCKVDVDVAAGKNEARTFDKAGVASIVCRLHPDMSMYVVVLDNPYFTTIEIVKAGSGDDAGSTYSAPYAITGVPPGDYTLTFWNKKLAARKIDVTIKAGEDVALDIEAGEP